MKLRMSQIMVEAFARSLIDKIMLEAFEVVDPNEEKLRILNNQQESVDIESESTRTTLQMCDRDEMETTRLIEKMVRGLHDLQIGDSPSVSPHLSTLEKQVKHAICNINDPQADSIKTHISQGQGDVHQIVHDAVIETTSDSTRGHQEKGTNSSSEATRVSVNLLHRMIEELETKVEESSNEKDNESESTSKERLAVWEETEERFIRTIESVCETNQSNTDPPTESNSRTNACEFAYDDLTSSPIIHAVPFGKNLSLEDVAIEEIVPSPLVSDDPSPEAASRKTKKKSRNEDALSEEQKKRSVLSKMRQLLRTIFGRRKK